MGEAEETLLALERGAKIAGDARVTKAPRFERRGKAMWWIAPAMAAAFVIGLLIPRPAPESGAAMLHSHFSHAQFNGNGPPAKVLYARDRSCYYVIVEGKHNYDVYGVAKDGAVRLGATSAMATTSELFSREPGRFDRIELRDRGTVVEGAAIR